MYKTLQLDNGTIIINSSYLVSVLKIVSRTILKMIGLLICFIHWCTLSCLEALFYHISNTPNHKHWITVSNDSTRSVHFNDQFRNKCPERQGAFYYPYEKQMEIQNSEKNRNLTKPFLCSDNIRYLPQHHHTSLKVNRKTVEM